MPALSPFSSRGAKPVLVCEGFSYKVPPTQWPKWNSCLIDLVGTSLKSKCLEVTPPAGCGEESVPAVLLAFRFLLKCACVWTHMLLVWRKINPTLPLSSNDTLLARACLQISSFYSVRPVPAWSHLSQFKLQLEKEVTLKNYGIHDLKILLQGMGYKLTYKTLT